MDRKEAMRWVRSVCAHDLRRSQAKTLSYLVVGAMFAVRISLASIGRGMSGRTRAKHKIKRVDRFLGNERIESSDAMGGLIRHLLHRHRRGWRNKPLVVSLDWVKVRGFHTLMAAMVFKGRAVPLVWGSYGDKVQGKSQNALEEALLTLLRQIIPAHVKVIVLADRGFGRAELGRLCQNIGLDYVIRICTKVWIKTPAFSGKLKDYPVSKGDCRLLRSVEYRRERPVVQNLIIRWPAGLSDEPWYLMTSLDKKPAKISQRLLLILAMAYLLLCGLGLCCKKRYASGRWSSTNRADECSAFFIARVMLDHSSIRLKTALSALVAAMATVANWG